MEGEDRRNGVDSSSTLWKRRILELKVDSADLRETSI